MIAALALALVAQSPELQSELTLFLEPSEAGLRIEESWAVENPTDRTLTVPAIPLPNGAAKARLSPESKGFAIGSDGRSITTGTPLDARQRAMVQLQYELPASSSVDLTRASPLAIARARFIVENAPDLTVASSEKLRRSERDVNGIDFVLYDLDAVPAGKTVTLSLSGIPSPARWPRALAIALSVLIVLAAAYMIRTRKAPGADQIRSDVALPLSGAARKERLVKAVELVDRDLGAGKLDAEQHARRRAALVSELAVVLREIELEGR